MLTVVLVIHDGTGITVNDISKLFLRHSFLLPSPFDGKSYTVEVKLALVPFKSHNITRSNFIFRVISFERCLISYLYIFYFVYFGGEQLTMVIKYAILNIKFIGTGRSTRIMFMLWYVRLK